MGMGIADLPQ